MKEKNLLTLDDLTKGNIWSVSESELANMLIEGKKDEDYGEMEAHYMNIIRTVFDITYLARKDEQEVERLEQQHYEIFSYPSEGEGEGEIDAIAIRKHAIKKITDLTLENVQHLDAVDVLELIKNNMGTGWKGLSLSIQDIIESTFYVDYTTLPAATMHRAGGIIDKRKEDGYDVLEIMRGGWIEAIFMKAKPKVEKIKTDFTFKGNDDDEMDSDSMDDDDEEMGGMNDDNGDEDRDDDVEEPMDDENPELEDIEVIEDMDDVDGDDDSNA